MKLVSLNIFGGRVHKPLLDFLKEHENIDFFCFQEVYDNAEGKEIIYLDAKLNIYKDIEAVLLDYKGYYRPHLKDYYGLAVFVKKGINVVQEGEHYVHKNKGYIPVDHVGFHAKNIQYIKVRSNKKDIFIINFHGLWNGKGKTDTEERLNQSKKIKEFVDSLLGEKILCGDFNLLPDTKSLEILEQGMSNLIKVYGITSTRTSLYTKPVRYADYVLISPDIKVENFTVLPDEVSDHCPLFLEFN